MLKLLLKYTKQFKFSTIATPILVIIEVFFDMLIPYIMSLIIDVGVQGANGPDINYIISTGLIMIGVSILSMFCGMAASYTAATASAGFILNLREEMYKSINNYSFSNIEKFEVPSIVTRFTKDMRELRMAYSAMIRPLFRAPLMLVFSAIMALKINTTLAGMFIVVVPILMGGLLIITNLARPRFRKLMKVFDDMNSKLEENFTAIRVVKTFVREKFEIKKFDNTSKNTMDYQRYAENMILFNDPFFNLVYYACLVAISFFGGKLIIVGDMTTGGFMAYLSYLKSILFSLLMLSNIMMQIAFAQASVDRVNEILDEKPEITDQDNDPQLEMEDGSIEFKNVSFAYNKDAKKMALSDVNLKIASGETVGIIGSTGSSKTTLVQLIDRLYDASVGEVIVGKHNVKEYTFDNLRKNVAMVLQKNVLFTGTIKENLLWGNKNATDEEIKDACISAAAYDFVMSFPKGFETDLGQGGVNVSGGQKQRLCIARALLKKPKIIILDDSTSAVDTATDKMIRTQLKTKLASMTTIIIAQRISSVMDCDKIVVMADGKIVDVGKHQELMARNEVYADLYNTQSSGVSE